jgi:hypothetical protein
MTAAAAALSGVFSRVTLSSASTKYLLRVLGFEGVCTDLFQACSLFMLGLLCLPQSEFVR